MEELPQLCLPIVDAAWKGRGLLAGEADALYLGGSTPELPWPPEGFSSLICKPESYTPFVGSGLKDSREPQPAWTRGIPPAGAASSVFM